MFAVGYSANMEDFEKMTIWNCYNDVKTKRWVVCKQGSVGGKRTYGFGDKACAWTGANRLARECKGIAKLFQVGVVIKTANHRKSEASEEDEIINKYLISDYDKSR